MLSKYKTICETHTSPIAIKERRELKIKVPEEIVVFFIGGAGDKEAYYFSGPFNNIKVAENYFDSKATLLPNRKLYKIKYVGYNEARGEADIETHIITNIPKKTTPIYIIGHSLGGWNGAHLSNILTEKGYVVEMLIALGKY